MKNTEDLLLRATGGLTEVTKDMMPATGPRPLIFDDDGLLWLDFYGKANGFAKDSSKYRMLPFLGEMGNEFEAAYIRNEAPFAVTLLEHDWEVRNKASFEKTLHHLKRGTKWMHKAALWWQPQGIYGVADAIVHSTTFYKRYPHLKPTTPEPPHYIIIDFKFSRNLDSKPKEAHLEAAIAQVRLYSYIVGHLQDFIAPRAFLITPDRIDDPISVAVGLSLNKPLDAELCDIREEYLDIKLRGDGMRPWKDKKVALNPANKDDAPWTDAKHQILTELVRPRSLLLLPGIGQEKARQMRLHGYTSVDDLLTRNIDRLRLENVPGISVAHADRLRAVLKANKTERASEVPAHVVPRKADVEIFLDFEYLTSLRPDWDVEWPNLTGTPMIFMVGCGWKEGRSWKFKRFVAEEETHEAEGDVLRKFLAFLRKRGVFDPEKTVALYHWSSAEVWQAKNAAQRYNLSSLENLPFVDLQTAFLNGPIALPNAWGFGLKEIVQCLGDTSPTYQVKWPEGLGTGSGAMIAGWRAYEQEEPLKSPEMRLIAEYLEVDCLALERILSWLRNQSRVQKQASGSGGGWYRLALPTA